MALRISEFAREGGVGVETVRYYQRKGLLAPPASAAPAGRHYGTEDVRRLRFIRAAQDAGFTLKEIGELLVLDRSNDRQRAKEMARARLAEIDASIAVLTEARNKLSKLVRQCVGAGRGVCPIIASFE